MMGAEMTLTTTTHWAALSLGMGLAAEEGAAPVWVAEVGAGDLGAGGALCASVRGAA
jgi:hypothetical protein